MPHVRPSRRALLTLALFALAAGWTARPAVSAEATVTVFAASSLKDALTAIATRWEGEKGRKAVLSFAASSALARQVEQGAPADIFISADARWMDRLADAGLVAGASRRDLVGNRLVLVGPANAPAVDLSEPAALGVALGQGRLAVGLTASVPAGIYARQALERLKLWDGVRERLAEAENVRAALTLVARGEAPLGVVYETDARVEPGVKVLARFPESSHDPIVYPAALTRQSEGSDAAAFLAYLQSPPAADMFRQAGFTVPAPGK